MSDTRRSELQQQWPLVLASLLGVASSSFVLPYYSIGALVVPVTEELGWTRGEFQLAILFSSGLGALTSPVVGWFIDHYGARRIALPAMMGLGLGFLLAAAMGEQLWMLFLAYGSMALLGAGTIPVTWTRAIATNFFTQRGLALGLTLTGTGLCAVLAPHYTTWLTHLFGWRGAYVGLGLIPTLFVFPVLYLLFRPEEHKMIEQNPRGAGVDNGMTLSAAAGGYRFWILLVSILFAYMGFSGIGPNLIPSLTDDGFSPERAATVQSIYGGSIVAGRVIVGYLVDKLWAPGVAAASLVLPTLGTLALVGDQSFMLAAVAAFLIGFAAGAELDLMAFLAARYFGLRHYAKIYSVLYATLAVCAGTAPFLFATVYDRTASYDSGFMFTSVLFPVAAALMLCLGRYPREYATG